MIRKAFASYQRLFYRRSRGIITRAGGCQQVKGRGFGAGARAQGEITCMQFEYLNVHDVYKMQFLMQRLRHMLWILTCLATHSSCTYNFCNATCHQSHSVPLTHNDSNHSIRSATFTQRPAGRTTPNPTRTLWSTPKRRALHWRRSARSRSASDAICCSARLIRSIDHFIDHAKKPRAALEDERKKQIRI